MLKGCALVVVYRALQSPANLSKLLWGRGALPNKYPKIAIFWARGGFFGQTEFLPSIAPFEFRIGTGSGTRSNPATFFKRSLKASAMTSLRCFSGHPNKFPVVEYAASRQDRSPQNASIRATSSADKGYPIASRRSRFA
jgi:hypothetical protein